MAGPSTRQLAQRHRRHFYGVPTVAQHPSRITGNDMVGRNAPCYDRSGGDMRIVVHAAVGADLDMAAQHGARTHKATVTKNESEVSGPATCARRNCSTSCPGWSSERLCRQGSKLAASASYSVLCRGRHWERSRRGRECRPTGMHWGWLVGLHDGSLLYQIPLVRTHAVQRQHGGRCGFTSSRSHSR